MSEVIGNRNEAYNIGRKELLAWLNETLQVNYSKIEEVANGAAFCQIMDAAHPGKVPLQKVNFNASLPHQVTQNYKVLQQMFTRFHVSKDMDVDKLQSGLFQDNLEFLQWIKHYHDVTTSLHPGEYKARERRKACGCEEPKCNTTKAGVKRQLPGSSSSSSLSSHAGIATKKARTTTAATTSTVHTRSQAAAAARKGTSSSSTRVAPAVVARHQVTSAEDEEELQKISESHVDSVTVQQFADLKVSLETMEKERDFYYGKLRAVEDLCQGVLAEQSEKEESSDSAASPLTTFVNQVISILYKKDDEDEGYEEEEEEEQEYPSATAQDANEEPLVV